MVQNKALMYRSIPDGMPVKGKNLDVEDLSFDESAAPPPGGITIRNHYASFDPYLRGRMRPTHIKSYSPALEANTPIANFTISRVLKSDSASFSPGDTIRGMFPIQEYATLSSAALKATSAEKLSVPANVELKSYLSALGMPGVTAYSSLYEIGRPKRGETIFISAASGAVGSIVGQLAKHEGLTVIGSVGSDDKLSYILDELRFDAAFNYKKEAPAAAIKRLAPDGIDIYYENVGGETLQAAFDAMNTFGRIVSCGMISQYNLPPKEQTPLRNVVQITAKRLKIQGFIQGDPDFAPKWGKEHMERVGKWIADGTFKDRVDVTAVGMDESVEGLLGIFEGKNFGKAVLEIAKPEK